MWVQGRPRGGVAWAVPKGPHLVECSVVTVLKFYSQKGFLYKMCTGVHISILCWAPQRMRPVSVGG